MVFHLFSSPDVMSIHSLPILVKGLKERSETDTSLNDIIITSEKIFAYILFLLIFYLFSLQKSRRHVAAATSLEYTAINF